MPGLRPIVVRLRRADIGLRIEIAVANLAVGEVAVGGDRGDRLVAQLDIELARKAIALLDRAGDEVLVDRVDVALSNG